MPTYKVSPFVNAGFQNYLFTGADIDQGGKLNVTGTSGSVYTVNMNNLSSGGATTHNWMLIWDDTAATTAEAGIVVPVKESEGLIMWVDKGITCSTAITVAGSSVAEGGVAPSGTMGVNLFID